MQFDYDRILSRLMTPKVMAALGDVRERKGRETLYRQTQPETLSKLCDVAKIQSTGASNRIENVSTTDKRLRELMAEDSRPRNRDEREIAGYRYVLDMIHRRHDDIPVTPGVILQLHRDLYRYTDASFAGRFKDSDNVIAERADSGEMVARFRPTSAAATPSAVERICDEYRKQIDSGAYDPLLASLVFVFDFVSIHPFNDGNGRMSRLMTLLLMYRNGYTVGKYASVESEIENTKSTYYEVLAASSAGWDGGESDYEPFVVYMLGAMAACYGKLDARMAAMSAPGTSEDVLRRYFDDLPGSASKREVMDDNPTMSQRTVERVLQKLQAEGLVEKVGAARATRYRKVR
ncbi:Fic family protein [Xiamenia xianingshaonis]|uniref:Cell filamentation protein Fic n=1 Tax=Xiamenia xianingshaonis TaxID=2682776 RepID=A0A9E6MPM0_9ACTN|nr:Fic family protein [Xiamenia xianingshaonis]NHM14287.1 cell filamentation protein Fic [Xiamenia xianingshaonis]QTU84104.1 Fic family protein [Xiamenia xianingshaonis]